jgi:tetratricopeptide (TPR) repeat protein
VLAEKPDDWTAHLILAASGKRGRLAGIPAGEHLERVEALAPDTADAYYLRALLTDSGREALELLDRALLLEPAHAPSLYERMSRQAALKNFPAALTDAERLTLVRPRSAQGYRAVAWIHWKRYDIERAMVAAERAIALDPDDPITYLMLARIHCRAAPSPGWEARSLVGGPELEQCLADLTHAIELDPGIATYYVHRSQAYITAGQFEEAVTDARQAIELHPDHHLAYPPLFRAYLSLGREQALREALEELRSTASGWADRKARAWAHREMADYYRQLEDNERALDEASRAIDLDPGDSWNYTLRVRIRRHVGDEEGVEADCDAMAALEPREPNDLWTRGQRLGWQCHRWEQALKDIDVLVERHPNWSDAHHLRGVANTFFGRLEEAVADFTRTIELSPHDPVAYNNRGELHGRLNRFAENLADLEKAVALNPYHSRRAHLGWLKVGFGRVEEVLVDFDKTIELNPLYGPARVYRGIVLAMLGDCDGAMEELSHALEPQAQGAGTEAPEDPQLQASLARAHTGTLYFFCPERYDAAAALDWASRAMKSVPELFISLDSYAAALYRNGGYLEARESLLKSVRFSGQTPVWNSFYLAMSSWRLGMKSEARSYFKNGAAVMDEHKLASPSLIRLREEAAALLGIEPLPVGSTD